ncbi:MAG TPA: protoporphyrinogen oxidase [Solirubrobacteraceae bacterium]|jgi:oxygen-dependent protoporphyrinogen oxidase
MSQRHVVVVGGGITGLTAARALLGAGTAPVRVTLVESSERLGGKIRTEQIASKAVDVGAEALLTKVPGGLELCRELGLQGELISPAEKTTYVWARGRLRELPAGILAGLPDGAMPLLRSGILSPSGVARAALDLVLPAAKAREDRSVGELVRGRLGQQALDRLVDPLLGTIYAADSDSLSVRATAPQIETLARKHRSLILASRGVKPPPYSGPMFVTVAGGLQRIVDRLRDEIAPADVRLQTRATRIERAGDGRYRLELSAGETLSADGIVIAAPASEASSMLSALSPAAADELRGVRYTSTVLLTLRYPSSAARAPLHGAGFLVPQSTGWLLGACTWLSAKWTPLAAGEELWLRCSIARPAIDRASSLDDEQLTRAISDELTQAMGLLGRPLTVMVTRWHHALPVYEPGHLDRMARLEEHVSKLPGLELAGAAYRGIGVPQCIAQGKAAVVRVLSELDRTIEPGRERNLGADGDALTAV